MSKILLLFFLVLNLYSNTVFTKEEKQWIENNPKVKIAMLNNFEPFSYVSNNIHEGYSVDLLKEISRISGLEFEIKTSRWFEALNSFKNEDVEMISDISFTKERENFSLFSKPYFEIPTFIFGLENDNSYKNNDSLKNKKVGISKGLFYKKDLEKFGLKIIELTSANEKVNSLVTGKIDYFLSSYTTAVKAINSQSLVNIKPIDEFKGIKKEDLRFGINKNKPLLNSIIKKSLENLNDNYFDNLSNKWILNKNYINENQINFTKEEKEYIQNTKNNSVKIGSIDTYIPFSFVYNDIKVGFTQELLELISKKSGLNFEKVGGTWPEVFGKFKDNKIDVISELSYREERLPFTIYTNPYYEIPISVFAKDGYETYLGIESLTGKKVGVVKGSYLISILKELEGFEVVEFDTNNDKFYGLRDGLVDVVLSSTMSIYRLEKLMIKGIKPVGLFNYKNVKNEDLRFGIRIEKPILASIFRKTLDSISFSTLTKLKQKWILENYNNNNLKEENNKQIILTKKEKEFIKNHPEITYSEINWKPLSIIENNSMNGILGEYLNLISKRTGISFKYIPSNTWLDVLKKFEDKQIDIIPSIGNSLKETKLGLLSKSYSRYPMVIVTGENIKYIQNLNELKNKTIAVPKHYTSHNFLLENYPDIKLITTSNIKDALLMVESKKADAFIGHIATSLYYLTELHLKNLKISGVTDFEFEHKYLIQDDYPELLSIINKAFNSISEIEKKKIDSKWVQPLILKESIDYSLIYKLTAVFIIILLVISYFLNVLKNQKKEFETIFYNTKDGIAITDLKTKFLKYNDEYLKILDYTDNELKEKFLDDLIATEDKKFIPSLLQNILNDGYVKNFETVFIGNNGKRIDVNMTVSLLPDKKRLLIVLKDVTSLKLFENNMKLASMGEMLGNIAHQWRQPLSVITMTATGLRVLSEYEKKVSQEDIRSFSDNILNQAVYLSETIDDFKNFIKGNNEHEKIDILNIVQKSLSLTKPTTSDNFINIITQIDDNIEIKGNISELGQVLINVINNAKDALIQNVDEGNRYIFVSTKKHSDNILELKIRDNAGGIPQDIIDRVFEPYFTTKHKSIGTGLGLSIVDKIIRERHNQTISVHNEEFEYNGKIYTGACFSIVFTKE